MPQSDPAIRVSHVSKDFVLPHDKISTVKGLFTSFYKRHRKTREVQHALKDVSFEVKTGEFFGIVGRNGSGKSTLLKILAEIYQPTAGSVEVSGRLVPFIELGVGFNEDLTGRENVYLNGAMLGFSTKEIDAMYDDIVDFAEIEQFMDQKLKNYSSGMQVRLAFSLATRAQADILLVDEVLAVGDMAFQRKCFEYFKDLKAHKKTVVFVTHDMDAVREYCDRAMLIDQSRIVTIGDAKDVAEAYAKIFNAPDGSMPYERTNENKRWGDGAIEMQAPKVTVNDKKLEISVKLIAKRPVSDQVAGIGIEGGDGIIIFGTNTQILRQPLPAMKAGESLHIVWTVDNIFAAGSYRINLTVHGYGGQPVYDWWDHAAVVRIKREQMSTYAVAPDTRVVIQAESKHA